MIGYLPPIIPPGRRPADLVLRVEEVTSGAQRAHFVSLPRRLYRGDRRWIPPTGSARRDALRPRRNPLLEGGDLGAFLGIAQNLGLGDETVGMLAAWWAPASAGAEDRLPTWGRWGPFEAMNVEDLADRLFYEAENWLFEHTPGIAGIRGPYGPEPLVAPGLLTDGFDAQPLALLPYNPPYYPELIESQGYEPGQTWRAYALDVPAASHDSSPAAPVSAELWQTIAAPYAVQDLETGLAEGLVPGLAAWLNHLGGAGTFAFNRSWQRTMGGAFGRAIAATAEDGEGGIGACFGIPDTGAALRLSGGRTYPVGWLLFELALRRTRRLNVFPAAAPEGWDAGRLAELYTAVVEAAASAGHRQAGVAPVSDDDKRSIEALARIGARPVQQFTIYEKLLA